MILRTFTIFGSAEETVVRQKKWFFCFVLYSLIRIFDLQNYNINNLPF